MDAQFTLVAATRELAATYRCIHIYIHVPYIPYLEALVKTDFGRFWGLVYLAI